MQSKALTDVLLKIQMMLHHWEVPVLKDYSAFIYKGPAVQEE
jgi:hypothetical protein